MKKRLTGVRELQKKGTDERANVRQRPFEIGEK